MAEPLAARGVGVQIEDQLRERGRAVGNGRGEVAWQWQPFGGDGCQCTRNASGPCLSTLPFKPAPKRSGATASRAAA